MCGLTETVFCSQCDKGSSWMAPTHYSGITGCSQCGNALLQWMLLLVGMPTLVLLAWFRAPLCEACSSHTASLCSEGSA